MNQSHRTESTGPKSSPPIGAEGKSEDEEAEGRRAVGTCLVTGGAGFLGINLVRYLRERGIQVISLDFAPFDYPERDSVKVLDGDIRDVEVVRAAMEGVDLVVHAAAALPLYSAEEIFSTDIDGIRNVLEAAHDSGVDRLIHISSTAVYGIPDHHPLKEDDRLHGSALRRG